MERQFVKIAAKTPVPRHSIIFLHGLGDTGNGWSFLAEQLRSMNGTIFNACSFIFPTAPMMPITANGGYPMNAWFDIFEWDPDMKLFDEKGLKFTLTHHVKSCVEEQIASGIKPENIVLGGFSQGAAVALGSAISLPWKLGGFISLSGFINCQRTMFDDIYRDTNKDTPIFHGHGVADPVVSLVKGQQSRDWLVDNYRLSRYTFKSYPGLAHSLGPEELQDVYHFLVSLWS